MSNSSSILQVLERGSAQVRWCEDVIVSGGGDSKHELWIAEFYNTMSNLAFVIASGIFLFRLISGYAKPINWKASVLRDIVMLVGVGFGSMCFHAHQSLLAQYSDEIPMSIIMLVANHGLEGLHPWLTHPESKKRFHAINYAFVACFWALYFHNGDHDTFTNGFGVQVVINLGVTFDAGRRVNLAPDMWWNAVYALIMGRAVWQLERHRFQTDNCFAPGTMLLHPLWHIFAALYYYMAVLHAGEIDRLVQERKSQDKKAS